MNIHLLRLKVGFQIMAFVRLQHVTMQDLLLHIHDATGFKLIWTEEGPY